MPKPSEEFSSTLTEIINQNAADKKLVLMDELLDKLKELALNLFDQCIGQLSPAEVGERIAKASDSTLDRARFRKRVKRGIYDDSDRSWKSNGGQAAADSTLLAFKRMGETRCVELAKEVSGGENWFPFDDYVM